MKDKDVEELAESVGKLVEKILKLVLGGKDKTNVLQSKTNKAKLQSNRE